MKILILHDDEGLNMALHKILSEKRLCVDCATSAARAVDMVECNQYDMILIDYAMPQHDGIWFMSNAKIPRSTKVLLMTGFVEREVINKMFELGACGYIIKPVDEEELMRNINFFLPGCLTG